MLRLACSAVKKLFVGVSLTRFPVSGCGRIMLFHRKAPKLWELLLLTPPHTRNIWEKGQLCSRRSGRAPPSSLQPGPFSNLPNPIFSYLPFFFLKGWWGGRHPSSRRIKRMSWQLSRGSAGPRKTTRRRSQGVIEGPGRNEGGGRTRKQKCLFWTWLENAPFPAFLAPNCISKCFPSAPPQSCCFTRLRGFQGVCCQLGLAHVGFISPCL